MPGIFYALRVYYIMPVQKIKSIIINIKNKNQAKVGDGTLCLIFPQQLP
jgi:hypothetical protein